MHLTPFPLRNVRHHVRFSGRGATCVGWDFVPPTRSWDPTRGFDGEGPSIKLNQCGNNERSDPRTARNKMSPGKSREACCSSISGSPRVLTRPTGQGLHCHQGGNNGGSVRLQREADAKIPSSNEEPVHRRREVLSSGGRSIGSTMQRNRESSGSRWASTPRLTNCAKLRTQPFPTGAVARGNKRSSPTKVRMASVSQEADANHESTARTGPTFQGFRSGGVHGSKTEQQATALHGRTSVKRTRRQTEVQIRGNTISNRTDSTGGSCYNTRPGRLLSTGGFSSSATEILPFPRSSTQKMAMENVMLRSRSLPSNCDKDLTTANTGITVIGNTIDDVHRRPAYIGPGQAEVCSSSVGCLRATTTEWNGVKNQTQQVKLPSPASVHFSGTDIQYNNNEYHSTCEKDLRLRRYRKTTTEAGGTSAKIRTHITPSQDKRPGKVQWTGSVTTQGNATGETPFAIHTAISRNRYQARRLEWSDLPKLRGSGCATLVDETKQPGCGKRRRCSSASEAYSSDSCSGRKGNRLKGHRSVWGMVGGKRHSPDNTRFLQCTRGTASRQLVGAEGTAPDTSSTFAFSSSEKRLAFSSRQSYQRQYSRSKIWECGSITVTKPIKIGSRNFRRRGTPQHDVLPFSYRGSPASGGGCRIACERNARRLDVGPIAIPQGDSDAVTRPPSRHRSVRGPSKPPGAEVLLVPARPRCSRNELPVSAVETAGGGVHVPAPNLDRAVPTETTPRRSSRGAHHRAFMGSPTVVPNVGVHGTGTTAIVPTGTVDHAHSQGRPVVEMPVALDRVAYLRQQIQHIGYKPEDLESILEGVSKRGDQKAYDAPVRLFLEWAVRTVGLNTVDSRTICPSILVQYLKYLQHQGASSSVLAKARSAVSATVSIATDGATELGDSRNVKRFMAGVKQQAPLGPKKLAVPSYHDVALLYSLVWLYGPNEALSDGLLKEKMVTLLVTDGALRPSDVQKLYRALTERHQQIKFDSDGMQIRFWWPKEVVPGSSRRNSTNRWFSKWVCIKQTTPAILCTVRTMKDFLQRTSDPALFATTHIEQINSHVQPLVWGRSQGGVLLPASVDHISNLVQQNIDFAQMGKMTTSHLRGASTSKVVDLVPELRSEAMALGRWTTEHTFNNHYYAPLLVAPKPVPATMRSNLQQVLRWGWKAIAPTGVTISDYEKGPPFWIGKSFMTGKIVKFADGLYTVKHRGTSWTSTHEDLMIWVGSSR